MTEKLAKKEMETGNRRLGTIFYFSINIYPTRNGYRIDGLTVKRVDGLLCKILKNDLTGQGSSERRNRRKAGPPWHHTPLLRLSGHQNNQ